MKQVRRLPDPLWVMDDARMKDVVLSYLERMFYVRHTEDLAHDERIVLINAATKRQLVFLERKLDDLLKRYNEDSKTGSKEYLRRLHIEIQNMDSRIVILRRGIVAVMFAAVHYYYKLGWNSVVVAEELGMKAPAVRMWMFRLNHLADGVEDSSKKWRGRDNARIGRSWPRERLQKLFVLRMKGLTFTQCSKVLGVNATSLGQVWINVFGDLTTNPPREKQKFRRRRIWGTHLGRKRAGWIREALYWNSAGIPVAQIARALGVPYVNVWYHVSKARSTARRATT